MISFDNLPILLVSAGNKTLAASVITDLIDNDVTAKYVKAATTTTDRIWRLVNKYYSADVRVHALGDDEILDVDPELVEAHIIYISEEEINEGVECAERRVAGSCGTWRDCDVRVLLLDSAGAGGPWGAWAAAARAELVPRRELAPTAVPAPEPFADAYGMERARAALHAHPWPNLQRTDGLPNARMMAALNAPVNAPIQIFTTEMLEQDEEEFSLEFDQDELDMMAEMEAAGDVGPEIGDSDGTCSDSDLGFVPIDSESENEEQERFAVEHAEAFAAALGALAEHPRSDELPDGLPRDARLDRAEELLTAFCRALGLDPDTD